ncbi:MAG: hypothetical protein Q9227_002649 [Pyrenula ochraceoflavens]
MICKISHRYIKAQSSVQQYLLSKPSEEHPALSSMHLQDITAQEELAQICLRYLLDDAISSCRQSVIFLSEYPFAGYAANHWLHHLMKPRRDLLDLVMRLFSSAQAFKKFRELISSKPRTIWKRNNDEKFKSIEMTGGQIAFASRIYLDEVISRFFERPGILPSFDLLADEKTLCCCSLLTSALDLRDIEGRPLDNLRGMKEALYQALQWRSLKAVQSLEILLKAGLGFEDETDDRLAPLIWMINLNKVDPLQCLIDRVYGVNNQTAREMRTPLVEAICEGSLEMVKILLRHGADPNKGACTDPMSSTFEIRGTTPTEIGSPSAIATHSKQMEIPKVLLDRSGSPPAPTCTSSHLLGKNIGCTEGVVPHLLDNGSRSGQEKIRDFQSETLLKIHSALGDTEEVQKLLGSGTKVADTQALFFAAKHSKSAIMPLLLAQDARLTVNHFAAPQRRPNEIKTLIDDHAENCFDLSTFTPLEFYGASIIKKGGDIHIRLKYETDEDEDQKPCILSIGAATNNPQLIQLLIDHGQLETRGPDGTPIKYWPETLPSAVSKAVDMEAPDALNILLDRTLGRFGDETDADILAQLLRFAALNGCSAVTQVLFQRGAMVDEDTLVASQDRRQVLRLLLEYYDLEGRSEKRSKYTVSEGLGLPIRACIPL